MSRTRLIALVVALALLGAIVVGGGVLKLALGVHPSASEPTANPTPRDEAGRTPAPSRTPTPTPTPTAIPIAGPAAPDPGTDDGTGGSDPAPAPPRGPQVLAPPPPPTPGVEPQILGVGGDADPAMCNGWVTIGAEVWDDVGVVSADLWMNGASYPMMSNVPTHWFVPVPVPPGAELDGGFVYTVSVLDGDGMGDYSTSHINVTC